MIPADFTSSHVLPAPLDVEQYLVRQEPPEVPSPDLQTSKAINGVAAFVARSGRNFEDMLKEKHLNNPQLAFLFEGRAGHEFYVRRLWEEERRFPKQVNKKILSRSDDSRVELLGTNRGMILGEKPLPKTEIAEASSVEQERALSELTAQMNTRFTAGAFDTQGNEVWVIGEL